MEIYHDILIGIERESKSHKPVKRTRVQRHSNLSYDKFSRHLNDMGERGLVTLRPLSITEKGREFVREYTKIRAFMQEIGAKFFETEPPARRIATDIVEAVPSMQHSVLLYDDRGRADRIAAEYLSAGLANGESCVYLALEDPKIVERRLVDLAGEIKTGIGKNRLRIYPGRSKIRKSTSSLGAVNRLVEGSTQGMTPPYRIFGNFGQIAGVKGTQSLLSIEKLFHENFSSLGITLLCWHDLKKISRPALRRFVESIIEAHHYVVYASDPLRAFAFDSSLLKFEA